jgi:hypothetical protein
MARTKEIKEIMTATTVTIGLDVAGAALPAVALVLVTRISQLQDSNFCIRTRVEIKQHAANLAFAAPPGDLAHGCMAGERNSDAS